MRPLAMLTAVLLAGGLAACAPEPESGLGDVSPPASPGSDGSMADLPQYHRGERVKLGDEEYLTVTGVSSWNGTDFVKPSANNTFVAVEVKIEGINPDGASVDPFWFSLEDSQMQRHDVIESGKDPMLQQSDSLAPDTPATGWVTFEIPEKEGQGLDLIYAPPFGGAVRVDLD